MDVRGEAGPGEYMLKEILGIGGSGGRGGGDGHGENGAEIVGCKETGKGDRMRSLIERCHSWREMIESWSLRRRIGPDIGVWIIRGRGGGVRDGEAGVGVD
jgi:hypothetical protein